MASETAGPVRSSKHRDGALTFVPGGMFMGRNVEEAGPWKRTLHRDW